MAISALAIQKLASALGSGGVQTAQEIATDGLTGSNTYTGANTFSGATGFTAQVTASAGLVVNPTQAAAISAARILTAADSGGTFSVAKTSAYAITIPTAAQGLKFKFVVLDTGANAVTISDGAAHLLGIASVNNVNVAMTGTTITLVATGSVGDWISFEGIDATHYLVTGACVAAGKITVA